MNASRLPLWKRALLLAGFLLLALVTAVVLTLSWLSFESRRDWARTKADLLARGEKLSLVELAPPPIPDERNFFGDSAWKELSDTVETRNEFGGAVMEPRIPKGRRRLDAMDPPLPAPLLDRAEKLFPAGAPPRFSSSMSCLTAAKCALEHSQNTSDPALRREMASFALDALAVGAPMRAYIELLLARPGAAYPCDYAAGLAQNLAPLDYLLEIARVYQVLARAHLALDRPEPAAEAVQTGLRLAGTLRESPLLIDLLVQRSILLMMLSAIDQGIAAHRWTEVELLRFQDALAGIDLPRHIALALRGERGAANQMFETLNRDAEKDSAPFKQAAQFFGNNPAATRAMLFAGDQGSFNRVYQRYIDALERGDGIRPGEFEIPADRSFFSRYRHFFTQMIAANLPQSLSALLSTQDAIRQTRIACALERARLRTGSYPAALGNLVPAFLPALPRSILAGSPFHYQAEAGGGFRLWSDGWDGVDNGGEPGPSRSDVRTGDWVWNSSPASAKPR